MIYVRGTLGIAYVVYVPHTLAYVGVRCYTQRLKYFLEMFKKIQRMRAYGLYVSHTLIIRYAYAGYARHTL